MPKTLDEALSLALEAEQSLLEEYGILRGMYERNPCMEACGQGVLAIRALREHVSPAIDNFATLDYSGSVKDEQKEV